MILIRDTVKLLGNHLILLRSALKLCWVREALRRGVTFFFFRAEMTPFWGLFPVILTSGSMSCPGLVRAPGITWKYKYDAPSPQTDSRTIIQYTPAMGSPGPLTVFTLKGLPLEPAAGPSCPAFDVKDDLPLWPCWDGAQVPTLSHGSGSRG